MVDIIQFMFNIYIYVYMYICDISISKNGTNVYDMSYFVPYCITSISLREISMPRPAQTLATRGGSTALRMSAKSSNCHALAMSFLGTKGAVVPTLSGRWANWTH